MPATLARDDTKALKAMLWVSFSAAGMPWPVLFRPARSRRSPMRARFRRCRGGLGRRTDRRPLGRRRAHGRQTVTVDSVFRWLERDGLGGRSRSYVRFVAAAAGRTFRSLA
jgi:hypothetical protein